MTVQHAIRPLRAPFLALALFVAGSAAHASPIDLFFNGAIVSPSDGNFYGLSTQSQADFVHAGGQVLPIPMPMFSLVGSKLTITNPADITSNYVPEGPDFLASPAQDRNTWQFTANQQLNDVWIVFRGHDPSDVLGVNNFPGGYLPENVGLNLDPTSATDLWRLVTAPAMGVDPATTYLALYLGNLSPGQSVSKTLYYRVRQAIITNPASGDLQFPQHLVGLLFAPVPEPGMVLLLAAGLGLGLGRRLGRGSRCSG